MAYQEEEKDKLFKEITLRITKGESVRNILKDKHMPATETFYKWLNESKERTKQYARACEIRADYIFDEIIDIADDSSGDVIKTEKGDVLNSEFVQRSRLRVDARKWIVSKLAPKKYGDKTINENINKNFDLSNLPEDEFNAELEKAKRVLNG